MRPMTREEKRAAHRAAQARYAATGKGRATARAAQARYEATEKGRARKRAYESSEKGRARRSAADRSRHAAASARAHGCADEIGYHPDLLAAVIERDGPDCAYCDRAAGEIDHVVPMSRGGPNAWDNIVGACRRCNASKGNRLLGEWRAA